MPSPPSLTCTLGQCANSRDPGAPFCKDIVAPAGVTAEANRAADMVEHDRRLGEGARQVGEFAELGVVHPSVKAETERRQSGKALAHPPIHQHAGGT